MTIRELICTCQNQWSSDRMFGKNPNFKFDVHNADERITIHFNSDYLDNDDWYDIEHKEVAYWGFDNGLLVIVYCVMRII